MRRGHQKTKRKPFDLLPQFKLLHLPTAQIFPQLLCVLLFKCNVFIHVIHIYVNTSLHLSLFLAYYSFNNLFKNIYIINPYRLQHRLTKTLTTHSCDKTDTFSLSVFFYFPQM